MPLGQLHISPGDLLLSVNGELSPRRQIAVDAHVQMCWECRTRLVDMQNAMTGFVDAYHSQWSGRLPAPELPRAVLRLKLHGLQN
jgi:anti-sigma factor RsiW